MAKLKDIDKAAESKGSFLVTVWQFVKFIVVSLLAMIVQFTLLNILANIPAIHDLYAQDFKWFVFEYLAADVVLATLLHLTQQTSLHRLLHSLLTKKRHSTQAQMLQLHFQSISCLQLHLFASQHGFHQHSSACL